MKTKLVFMFNRRTFSHQQWHTTMYTPIFRRCTIKSGFRYVFHGH